MVCGRAGALSPHSNKASLSLVYDQSCSLICQRHFIASRRRRPGDAATPHPHRAARKIGHCRSPLMFRLVLVLVSDLSGAPACGRCCHHGTVDMGWVRQSLESGFECTSTVLVYCHIARKLRQSLQDVVFVVFFHTYHCRVRL